MDLTHDIREITDGKPVREKLLITQDQGRLGVCDSSLPNGQDETRTVWLWKKGSNAPTLSTVKRAVNCFSFH